MNNVILIGRWCKDIDLQFISGTGTAIAKSTLAVDRKFKKEGQQETDFIPIVIFGKNAENTANYSKKGELCAVKGKIRVSSYDNKEGKKVYITEVVADEVQFLGSKNNTQSIQNTNFGVPLQTDDENLVTPVSDQDIPF